MSTNINELCSYRKCPALLNYGFLITFKMSLYVYFIYACFLFRKLASKHVLMRGGWSNYCGVGLKRISNINVKSSQRKLTFI